MMSGSTVLVSLVTRQNSGIMYRVDKCWLIILLEAIA